MKKTKEELRVRICFMEKIHNIADIESLVDDILTRGVGTFADPDGIFRKKLIAKAAGTSNEEIIVKFGVDPTRPDIHLGHAVVLRKLRQMQDLGVKVIFLIGDFTALIGDPTGKSKVRPELDQAAINANMMTYLEQVDKVLLVERDGAGAMKDGKLFSWMRNSDWFYGVTDITPEGASQSALTAEIDGKKFNIPIAANSFVSKAVVYENTRMQKSFLSGTAIHSVSLVNMLAVLRKISLAQLIERDMFQDRIKSSEPLFMHEMLYPVMQGIDSDVLAQIYGSCDLEVGGTDQTFNMLIGRKVMEMTSRAPQAVLAFELLVGLDGKEKMSKSLDNYVGITDEPNDMFGKLMSIPDSVLPKYFELCTYTPVSEVKEIEKKLAAGKLHPKEVKMDLAEQVVNIYHGADAGKSAREHFVNTFQKKEIPDNIPVVKVEKGTLLIDALLAEKIVESKTDFRRLLTDGAIRRNGDEKLTDPQTQISEPIVLKIGKHRFVSFDVN